MRKKVALFGGSFNPPGLHHRAIVVELLKHFEKVIVLPCGPRDDKETTNDISPLDRAIMADMTFGDMAGCEVCLDDLEQARFSTSWDLWHRFSQEDEVWMVVGSDLLKGGHSSLVYSQWVQGRQLWAEASFAILMYEGHPLFEGDILPPCSRVIPFQYPLSSTLIRQAVFNGQDYREFVVPRVREYIERYRLYRRMQPRSATPIDFSLSDPVWLHVDDHNPRVSGLKQGLMAAPSLDCARAIVSIGGDGTMLHAVKKLWRHRLPFVGLNAGHRGFLLNDELYSEDRYVAYQSPLLYVRMVLADGSVHESMAFNDAWVQCKPGTTGWMSVSINDAPQISRLVGDGVLVATATGSTAYARAMGANPIGIGTPSLILVGSNVSEPLGWKCAQLPLTDSISIVSLDDTSPPKKLKKKQVKS